MSTPTRPGTGRPAGSAGPAGPAGSVEALYPFLYAGQTDVSSVLEQVRNSTVAKAGQIIELRRAVRDAHGPGLAECAAAMAARFTVGGRLLAFGNGGSATDAQHLVTLFTNPGPAQASAPDRAADGRATDTGAATDGGVPDSTPAAGCAADGSDAAWPLPALGLASDPAVLTALANDIGPEVLFARQVSALGRPADIAVGLSTSGNSENLVRAFDAAAGLGMLTVGIAGYDGGRMAQLHSIRYLFVAPSASVHRIQEAQTTIGHVLWELCQSALRGGDGPARGSRAGPS